MCAITISDFNKLSDKFYVEDSNGNGIVDSNDRTYTKKDIYTVSIPSGQSVPLNHPLFVQATNFLLTHTLQEVQTTPEKSKKSKSKSEQPTTTSQTEKFEVTASMINNAPWPNIVRQFFVADANLNNIIEEGELKAKQDISEITYHANDAIEYDYSALVEERRNIDTFMARFNEFNNIAGNLGLKLVIPIDFMKNNKESFDVYKNDQFVTTITAPSNTNQNYSNKQYQFTNTTIKQALESLQ